MDNHFAVLAELISIGNWEFTKRGRRGYFFTAKDAKVSQRENKFKMMNDEFRIQKRRIKNLMIKVRNYIRELSGLEQLGSQRMFSRN